MSFIRNFTAPSAPPSVQAADRHGPDGAPAAKASSALGRHHHGLDGFRAIGMASVLVYHAELGMQGAFLALSQFFTLSGFLITAMLLRAHDRGGVDLRHFWTRRIRRLVPASLLALAGVVVFGATVATYDQAVNLPGQIAASLAWVVNWHFIVEGQSYTALFAAPSPIHHLWSLSVEEQFYLLSSFGLVGLLRFSSRTRTLVVVLVVAALASSAWTAHLYRAGAGLDRIYLGTDTRVAELLVGAILGVIVTRRPGVVNERSRPWFIGIGAAAYAVSLVMFVVVPLARGPFWEGGALGFAVLSALSILAILAGGGPVARLTSLGPIAWFGRLSYGIYLYHWPIYLWLSEERTGLDPVPLFGLRVAVTLAAGYASHRFVEKPFIEGRWRDRSMSFRVVAPLAAVAAILVGSFVLVDRNAYDPMATFRGDPSLAAPTAPDDGTLDVLAITDLAGVPVVRRMAEIGAVDDSVVVTSEAFGCTTISGAGADAVCTDWADRWSGLIRDVDPDVVLFFVNEWAPEAVAAASGQPVADAPVITEAVLDHGFDQLTARGAAVVVAHQTAAFGMEMALATRPFRQAIDALENRRQDIRRVPAGRIPDPAVSGQEQYVEQGATALIADLSLYRRAADDRLPRILVVGDSQARSLGYGLERWGAAEDRAVVWNAAVPGCGLVATGTTEIEGRWTPVSEKCVEAVDQIPDKVESFDPDLVIVLSSSWDLVPRRVGEGPVLTGDDGSLGDLLRASYDERAAELTAGGATVVWMTVPCLVPHDSVPDLAETEALAEWLNAEVIPPVVDSTDRTEQFDLAATLCPGGEPIRAVEGVGDLRSDGIHFSVEGSIWFAEENGEEILTLGGL